MADSSDSDTGRAIDYALIIIALMISAAATVAATDDGSGLTQFFMIGGLLCPALSSEKTPDSCERE